MPNYVTILISTTREDCPLPVMLLKNNWTQRLLLIHSPLSRAIERYSNESKLNLKNCSEGCRYDFDPIFMRFTYVTGVKCG